MDSYSNSSASSTASSMNWFTKLRESIRMPTQMKSDMSPDIVGWLGRRYISARFQTPRQNRMIAEPTRNASSRLFQRSTTVGLRRNVMNHFIFSKRSWIPWNLISFFLRSKKWRPSSEDSRTCRCIQISAFESFFLSASTSSMSSFSLFVMSLLYHIASFFAKKSNVVEKEGILSIIQRF